MSSDYTDQPDRQTVSDPEEFNQQRRLRSIHDARDRAREVRELTQDPSVQADQRTLAATYRAAVQNYVGELEGLLRRYEFDDDEPDYWTAYQFGPVEIPAPSDLTQFQGSADAEIIDNTGLRPKTRQIRGLNGYISVDCPFEAQFSVPVKRRHRGQETISATVTMEMPIEVSHDAYRIANRFMTMTGFDIEIATEHRAVITEELIEEVNEWHEQNVQQ